MRHASDEQPSDGAVHVTLVATPDTQLAPLSGLYEAFTSFPFLKRLEPDLPTYTFDVDVIAPGPDPVPSASGLAISGHRTPKEIARTDIAIVPLMMVGEAGWRTGRYEELVDWLTTQHERGAVIASACTGVLLLAETGLLDGREATIHWAFAPVFRERFPRVRLRTEEVLITAGDRHEFVMTGGVMSWHDLALHLIVRHVGPTAAQAMARLLMLEWHGEGQAPYIGFTPETDHGDAMVRELQKWISEHYMISEPVEALVEHSGLARRTLERRFRSATGRTPLSYVQAVRIGEAKRRLERTSLPVEKIALLVGYENTAFFGRLFRRNTRLTPGAYRKKFGLGRRA